MTLTINPAALERSTPEAQGVASTAILAFLESLERADYAIHSLMLLRHGRVLAEGWWSPYAADLPHMLFSLSKSFTASAVGFAAAEGLLSLDDQVIGFFPDDLPERVSPNLAAMRVRHLLAMSTGHATDTMPALPEAPDGNWPRAFLALPVAHEPGTHFLYNTGASYMLSAIVQRLTKTNLLEYLRPRLLDPLGIDQATWDLDPRGVALGGFGMSITTEGIARFGQFYLQKGRWGDRRLLPEAWFDDASALQTPNGRDPASDWAQGYGYQFWRCRHGAYRADGAFGQFCVILPEQDAVLAMTGGAPDMQVPLNIVWEHLLPAFGPAPLPPASAAHRQLTARLGQLAMPVVRGERSSPLAGRVSGRTYRFAPNPLKIEAMRLDFNGDTCRFALRGGNPLAGDGEHEVIARYGEHHLGVTTLDEPGPNKVAASGAWISDDTYCMQLYYYLTPFSPRITWRFDGERIISNYRINVSFGPLQEPEVVGYLSPAAE